MGLKALLLLLSACATRALLLGQGAAAASMRAAAAPCMKHNDHFLRVSRAESGRMRLCVHRSNNHIYGQVIDDSKHAIIAAASTLEPALKEATNGSNCEGATAVGKLLAERSLEKGVTKIFFDRNGYRYHGRVKALGDSAREAGLSF